MDGKEADELPGTADQAEDLTLAARRRARRVSFAETTAVHFFNRDEEYETPPDSKPGAENSPAVVNTSKPIVFQGDQSERDDSSYSSPAREHIGEGDDGAEEEEEHELFVKDMDSSPGSAVGSVTSNDDDNLFGPVSASFIRSGRLSEASDDDNHDITLDSATFSLHFRNVLASDDRTAISAGSIATPTGDSVPDGAENFMFLTGEKKNVSRSVFSSAVSSGGTGDTSKMSFIRENSKKYDYAKLPPMLEALLVEVNDSIQEVSPKAEGKVTSSSPRVDDIMVLQDAGNEEAFEIQSLVGAATMKYNDKSKMEVSSNSLKATANHNDLIKEVISSPPEMLFKGNINEFHDSFGDQAIIRRPSPSPVSKVSPLVAANHQSSFSDTLEEALHTPLNVRHADLQAQSSLNDSVSSLSAKRKQLYIGNSVFSHDQWAPTPQGGQSPEKLELNMMRHAERISAIKNSISKLKRLDTPKSVAGNSRDSLNHDYLRAELSSFTNGSKGISTSASGNNFTAVQSHTVGVLEDTGDSDTSCFGKHDSHSRNTRSLQARESEDITRIAETHRCPEINTTLHPPTEQEKMDYTIPAFDNNMEGSPHRVSFDKQHVVVLKRTSEPFTSQKLPASPTRILEPHQPQEEHLTLNASGLTKLRSSFPEKKVQSPVSNSSRISFGSSEMNQWNRLNLIANDSNLLDNAEKEIISSTTSHFRSPDHNTERKLQREGYVANLSKKVLITTSINSTSPKYIEDKMAQSFMKETDQSIVNSKSISSPLIDTCPKKPGDSDPAKEHDEEKHNLQNSFSEGAGNVIGKKRRNYDLFLDDRDESGRTKRNFEVASEVGDIISRVSTHSNLGSFEACNSTSERPGKNWNELLSKILGIARQQFQPAHLTLNSKEFDIFEDMLIEQKRARTYARLYTDIQAQRKRDQSGDTHFQRVAEAKLLQDLIVYRRAKLQLMVLKRDTLLKKSEWLQSRIQECHKLKCSLTHDCSFQQKSVNKETYNQFIPTDPKIESKEDQRKVILMRKELEDLEKKLAVSRVFFHASGKIKENASFDEVTKIAGDHLKQRSHLRLIHQELLLWEMNEVKHDNDRYHVHINYRNLLSQRFIIKVTSCLTLCVQNSVNTVNIEKKFPNLKACIAFDFLFSRDSEYKLANLKCFQQETQRTSYLFGNLLDLLGELQAAQIEIPSLISSSFSSFSNLQLLLELTFFNFKNGKKATLSIDMSNFNSGVYTFEPLELSIQISPAQSTVPPSALEQLAQSIRSVKRGSSIITRVCQFVSNILGATE